MIETLTGLLPNASLVLLFGALVGAGVGLPIPEEIVLLSAGALAHQGAFSLPLVAAVCGAGVLLGDTIIFLTARRLGARALERPLFRKLLPPHRRERVERLFQKRGGFVVFLGRHLPGLRAPIFAVAGMHHMAPKKFFLWDFLGLCVSATLTLSLGYLFADRLEEFRRGIVHLQHYIIAAAVAAVVAYEAFSYKQSAENATQEAKDG